MRELDVKAHSNANSGRDFACVFDDFSSSSFTSDLVFQLLFSLRLLLPNTHEMLPSIFQTFSPLIRRMRNLKSSHAVGRDHLCSSRDIAYSNRTQVASLCWSFESFDDVLLSPSFSGSTQKMNAKSPEVNLSPATKVPTSKTSHTSVGTGKSRIVKPFREITGPPILIVTAIVTATFEKKRVTKKHLPDLCTYQTKVNLNGNRGLFFGGTTAGLTLHPGPILATSE